jgi:hypothetical protein
VLLQVSEVLWKELEGKNGRVLYPDRQLLIIDVEGDLSSLSLMLQKQVLELVALIGTLFDVGLTDEINILRERLLFLDRVQRLHILL